MNNLSFPGDKKVSSKKSEPVESVKVAEDKPVKTGSDLENHLQCALDLVNKSNSDVPHTLKYSMSVTLEGLLRDIKNI